MSSDFFQSPPLLQNTFLSDECLQECMAQFLPAEFKKQIHSELTVFGEACANSIRQLGVLAERHPPQLKSFDGWGRRVDEVQVHPAWDELKTISAREGLVAAGFEQKYGEFSRLYQFIKLYLFHPSSAFFTCPLAMTDGAASVLKEFSHNSQLHHAFQNLTSRNPAQFWTSGQWMTEKTGGSDVSQTSTAARPDGDGYRLHGVKWFTSSVTSEMALGLARIEGAAQGSKGLSLFYIPMRIHPTELNNIQVLRLKDKLGTKALPTAELQLNGSHALLVGEPGHGIKIVTKMLNMTRLYNSVCSIAQMRRAYQLALDYADRRLAFGKKIADQPLHRHTLRLAKIAIDKAVILTFRMALLLGKEECHQADPTEQFLLRLLTPVTKLLTARRSIDICTEMLEAIGGAAYVEDTEFPALLRDAHVFPIWEGTTNVLSLDVLRVIEKSEHGLLLYFNELKQSIIKFGDATLRGRLLLKLDEFEKSCQALLEADVETIQTQARSLSYALGEWFSTIEMLKLSESTQFIDGLPSKI